MLSNKKHKKSSKTRRDDIKTIIKKGIDEFKKRVPSDKYNDNVIDMYLTHIIPYIINNKKTITIDEMKSNLMQFIEKKDDKLDSMLSEYINEINNQLSCPCRK
jgi:hypothetical protein